MPTPWDIVIPAAVSLVVMLVGRIGKLPWAGPVAAAGGFLSAFRSINGAYPPMPPSSATDWIFFAATGVGILAVFLVLARLPKWIGLLAVALAVCVTVTLVLWRRLQNGDGRLEPSIWILTLTVAAVIWWWTFQQGSKGVDRATGPIAMTILALFSAAILIMSESLIYGRLAIALAGAVIPFGLVSIRFKDLDVRGPGLVFAAVLAGLLAAGYFFANLSQINLILIIVSPLLMGIVRHMALRDRRAPVQLFASLAVLILPLLIASASLVPGFIRSISETQAPYGQ